MAVQKITSPIIDDAAITAAKIPDSAITNAKLAADGFDASKFTTGTLPIARIDDGAVTAAKLAGGAAASNLGTGNVTAAMLSSTLDLTGKTVTLPAGVGGKMLQVVSTTTNTPSSYGSGTSAISGLTVSITPSATSSKILLLVNLSSSSDSASGTGWFITKNGSALSGAIGASVSNRRATTAGGLYAGASDTSSERTQGAHYLDSPATTSSITYGVNLTINVGSAFVNRSNTDTDSADRTRSISTITAIEIGA